MATDTVKTRFLLLSDTHNALPSPSNPTPDPTKDIAYRWPLPKADVLIHAGDLTATGTVEEHRSAIELLEGVDAELKIVIPGNHDMTLHRDYCTGKLGEPIFWCPRYDEKKLDGIEEMYRGGKARESGIVYMVEEYRVFRLRSGVVFGVYANCWQPEFCNWGFNYERSQDRFNVKDAGKKGEEGNEGGFVAPCPVPDEVDVIVTHGPPMGLLDKTKGGENVGCEHLRRAVEKVKPRMHVFGHIHEAWGAVKMDWESKKEEGVKIPEEKEVVESMGIHVDATQMRSGKETLFVNASIMDLDYEPEQPPWVVDLMLPKGP